MFGIPSEDFHGGFGLPRPTNRVPRTTDKKHINPIELRDELYEVLRQCVGSDYAFSLSRFDDFVNEVREDVELCSAWEDEGFYNEDDIRLAVGRAVMRAFDCNEY